MSMCIERTKSTTNNDKVPEEHNQNCTNRVVAGVLAGDLDVHLRDASGVDGGRVLDNILREQQLTTSGLLH